MPNEIDAADLELLRQIGDGQRGFKPRDGEDPDPDFQRIVARLIRLRDRGLIRMPEPRKSFMAAHGGYLLAGPCELTADGFDALDRFGS